MHNGGLDQLAVVQLLVQMTMVLMLKYLLKKEQKSYTLMLERYLMVGLTMSLVDNPLSKHTMSHQLS